MKTFVFHQDSGHGWLAVKRKWLRDTGTIDKVSGYSYQNGATVYLEEDCDAPLFLEEYKKFFGPCEVTRGAWSERSRIRSYRSFSN